MADIIISSILGLVFLYIIINSLKANKKGGCGGNCGGCGGKCPDKKD